jgi:hypothetical protein
MKPGGRDPVWTLLRTAADPGAGPPARGRAYVALPSAARPLLVASRDAGVLRYVTDTLLAAPPGGGPARAAVYAAGRWLLRRPGAWALLALVHPSCTAVLVEDR